MHSTITNISQQKILLKRLLLFCFLFIISSGTIGPFVIGTKLLYTFYFFIYANMGKLLLYAFIVFFLLIKDKLNELKIYPFEKSQLIFLTIYVVSHPILFYLFGILLPLHSFTTNIAVSIASHITLLILVLSLLLGVFGTKFLLNLLKTFKKELLICLLIAIPFYMAIFYVWGFWQYLSIFVLKTEYILFRPFYPNMHIIPPYTLSFPTFSILIAEACSGLDSIFLFTALYAIIWIIERKDLNSKKMAIFALPALIGTILTNIIRVALLIIIGLQISPQLSATLFHTYLGMILFIIYFFIFWKISYRFVRKEHKGNKKYK